jgi:hypothetical protein
MLLGVLFHYVHRISEIRHRRGNGFVIELSLNDGAESCSDGRVVIFAALAKVLIMQPALAVF